VRFSAAAFAIILPTGMLPVKRYSPIAALVNLEKPPPSTTLTCSSWNVLQNDLAIIEEVLGVNSDGLITI
jgi:hypothetical protein